MPLHYCGCLSSIRHATEMFFSGLFHVVAALYWSPAGYFLIVRFFRNVREFFYFFFLYISTLKRELYQRLRLRLRSHSLQTKSLTQTTIEDDKMHDRMGLIKSIPSLIPEDCHIKASGSTKNRLLVLSSFFNT